MRAKQGFDDVQWAGRADKHGHLVDHTSQEVPSCKHKEANTCTKTEPAGQWHCISPLIGARSSMPSSGPLGLRGSRWDLGTIQVPPLWLPTSSGPRYHTVDNAMQTSGNGWRIAPQCRQGSSSLGPEYGKGRQSCCEPAKTMVFLLGLQDGRAHRTF